jgi:hypothetical protein
MERDKSGPVEELGRSCPPPRATAEPGRRRGLQDPAWRGQATGHRRWPQNPPPQAAAESNG